jgi:4,5-dihydroxyphthalate decarboxylase
MFQNGSGAVPVRFARNELMSVDTHVTTLSAAFDDYPHTLPLKRGEINSPRVAFAFSDIKPANRFFKPMVRELKFDVSEMAIATYVQAKAYGKPLVLMPATMMGRFQHGTILCNAARPLTPAELAGKRIGVRSYSQTTAVWVRGILENDYGVDLDKVRWVTFEDGHVAEYHEPERVERAGADKNLLKMLRAGELDAAIYGADLPNDPTLKGLIPDAESAAQRWYARHKVVPINHMVVVTEKLAKSNPQTVKEIYRLLLQAKKAAGLPKAGAIDFLPFGLKACRPALQTIITYALQQRLIPRKIEVEDLFDDTTRALES